jgi:hypothetical protein
MRKLICLLFFLFSFQAAYTQSIPRNIPAKKNAETIEETLQKKQTGEKAAQEKDVEKQPEEKKIETQAEKQEIPKEPKLVEKTVPKIDIDENQSKEKEKPGALPAPNYTEKGVVEIGGILWGEFKALKSGSLEQILWTNNFVQIFLVDYFVTGIRTDITYNFTSSNYTATGYLVAGGAFPVSDTLFMMLNINVGYSSNNYQTSTSLFSYGNEIGLKIKLKEHFLMGISAIYSFYTDFSKEFFNDKIKGMISFSGYF